MTSFRGSTKCDRGNLLRRNHHFRSDLLLPFIAAILLFQPPVGLAADNYHLGLSAYRTGKYTQAIGYLEKSISENPKDPTRLFYLGLSQAKNKDYQSARASFEQVLRIVAPADDLAVKARSNISFITKTQVNTLGANKTAQEALITATRYEDNYLSSAINNGKVVHWDIQKMPLKVYITDAYKVRGWRPEMKEVVRHAMNVWQTASLNKVRFIQTIHPENADITVNWKEAFPHSKVGENPFEAYGNMIIRSDITIALYSSLSENTLTLPELQKIAVHELGHALGIQGHSPYVEDIMYYAQNPAQVLPADSPLTMRDKKTLSLLYKIVPDIKNNTNLTIPDSKRYSDLSEAAGRWLNKKNYSKAIELYLQALRIKEGDENLYYNLAYAYQMNNDGNNAILYYRKSLQLDNNRIEPKYNLAGLLINSGTNLAKTNNMYQAKQYFQEAVNLYSDILRSSQAPQDTPHNLEIARKNLSLIP